MFIRKATLKDLGLLVFVVWSHVNLYYSKLQGPRSKFSSGGAKEECVKENLVGEGGGGGGGACLCISIQFL